MKNSSPRCHEFRYWGIFNLWLHRAQIIHHFHPESCQLSEWFTRLPYLVHYCAMLLSFESSPRIIHPFSWLAALHKFIQINIIYILMEYEVVVCERGTGKFVISREWRMCRKEEIMKCNHVKRKLSFGSQEDVTRISLGRICRLWEKSGKEEDPWQNIS